MQFRQISKATRLLLFYRAISFLPISIGYRIAPILYPMDRNFKNKYMGQWKKGLKICIEEANLPCIPDIEACASEHLRMLSYEALDSYLVPRIKPVYMKRLCKVYGTSHIKATLKKGNGLIIVTSHFCRVNMIPYSLGHMGIKNGFLSQSVDKDNPYLDWVDRYYLKNKLKKIYRVTKGPGITLKDNPRLIYKALEKNAVMSIPMDAFFDTIKKFYHVPFLGGTIRMARGIARISAKTKAPMVYAVVKPEKKWQVRVEISPIEQIGEEGFFISVKEFEKDVMTMPCQWWQWPYMESMWQGKS